MGSAVDLRTASAADAEAVATLHADSWRRHYRGAFADTFLDGDLVADRLAVWSERLRSPKPDQVTIVADVDDEPVGFVHVVLDDDVRWGSFIENLHVTNALRRGGIGSALMTRAAQVVAERGRTGGLYLWTLEQNTAAQAFYVAHGGSPIERAYAAEPGGVPGRLNGRPAKLRMAWANAHDLRRR
ncbi:GNAT family N-acetyltransferase [Catellatospora sichuanensis]|uniref:GNAT family N-acetyltransferase n=1 Tax=Catellatospora sichuanensis TaxID=1969805 RepID=UPI0011835AC7|nr:GNAT family N-acetyltransferase [Catellatospora sichuanensis]